MSNNVYNQYTPNPLRPYYIPPAHDFLTGKLSSTTPTSTSTAAAASSSSATGASHAASSLSSATRNVFSDIDYSDYYLETPSVGGMVRELFDTTMMRYTSVLILQPFKVAKTVMQCQYIPRKVVGAGGVAVGDVSGGGEGRTASKVGSGGEFAEYGGEWSGRFAEVPQEDEEDEEPQYFTSNDNNFDPASAEWSSSKPPGSSSSAHHPKREPSRGRRMTDRQGRMIHDATNAEQADRPEHSWQIRVRKVGAVGDVLGALWQKEGAWGVWKGSNSTFVYTILTSTIEAWTESLLAAIVNVPDPGLTDVVDSPSPLASLCIIVASSALTALLLAPLDIVRTRIILAPADDKPRNIVPLLKSLPSYLCPPALTVPTALHAALPAFVTAGVPYYLRTNFGVDPIVRPALYTMCTFFSSVAELFIRLPLETSLRRGQIAVSAPRKTVVPVGSYYGVFGTMWSIYQTEESGGSTSVEGLYRGWRVGMWGLMGMWAMGVFGGSGSSSGAPF